MENIMVKQLYRNTKDYLEKEIQLSGWVKTIRDSKTFGFIELNDGSFLRMYKLFLMIIWIILIKFRNYLLVLQLL